MGEAKQRRGPDPELVEVEWEAILQPSGRSMRRVQLAIAAAQGAASAAQAAQQVAQAEQARMLEAVSTIAEAEGWKLPKAPIISLEPDEGTITIMTEEAMQAKQQEEASGGVARGQEPRQRANGHSAKEAAPVASGESSK